MKRLIPALLVVLVSACTAKSVHRYPQPVQERYLITLGDTDQPYESLGYLQMTRKGADIFGFLSIVDADIEKLFGEELIKELNRYGADGIINVEFNERQWTTGERILFALPPMFLFPLPTRVTLTGEMIRFTGGAGAPPPPAPPPAEGPPGVSKTPHRGGSKAPRVAAE